jgi:hypothetical protein
MENKIISANIFIRFKANPKMIVPGIAIELSTPKDYGMLGGILEWINTFQNNFIFEIAYEVEDDKEVE